MGRRLSVRLGAGARWGLALLGRGVTAELAEASAPFAAQGAGLAGESSQMDAARQLLASRRGLERGSAVSSPSLLLPSCWPIRHTFTMLMVLNKGLVGVPLTLHNT